MRNIHFIGICGKGMSGLAVMLKHIGYKVTGSDSGFFDPTASYLKKHGIDFYTTYAAENIPKDVDAMVIGKHAKLTNENPEVVAAFQSDKKIHSLPSLLAELIKDRTQIMIAGSFGKSTCTGLASWILEKSDKNPGYFVGGEVHGMENSALFGAPPYFVIEGDEYPSANFDDRAKFLHFSPKFLLLTSAEHDHVNVFPTLESYLAPYKELIRTMPKDGIIVACDHGAHLRKILRNAPCKVIWYGYTDYCDYKIQNTHYEEISTVALKTPSGIATIETELIGKHNTENIAAVYALLDSVGIKTIIEHIKTFKGVKGRLDRLTSVENKKQIFLGFGSSHAKVRGYIDALKLHYPNKKLRVIFEPHTFSWRDHTVQYWYNDAFKDVEDVCIVMPPEDQGKESIAALSANDIKQLIEKSGTPTVAAENVRNWYTQTVQDGDIVLLLTSGNLQNIPKEIIFW